MRDMLGAIASQLVAAVRVRRCKNLFMVISRAVAWGRVGWIVCSVRHFGVAHSVAILYACERGLRVAARFPGWSVTVLLRNDVIAVMRVRACRCMYCRSISVTGRC
jgi:hypothetical protein